MPTTPVEMSRTAEIEPTDPAGVWCGLTFEGEGEHYHEPMVRYYADGSGYPGYDAVTIRSVTECEVELIWTTHHWSWYLYPHLKSRWSREHSLTFTLTDEAQIRAFAEAWGVDVDDIDEWDYEDIEPDYDKDY